MGTASLPVLSESSRENSANGSLVIDCPLGRSEVFQFGHTVFLYALGMHYCDASTRMIGADLDRVRVFNVIFCDEV